VSHGLKDNGSLMDTKYTRISEDAAPEIRSNLSTKEAMFGQYKSLHLSSHRKISVMEHARLLLEKMKSDNPVVILAKGILDNLTKT
jgi:hypothetical protein